MRKRRLVFALYGNEQDLQWTKETIRSGAAAHGVAVTKEEERTTDIDGTPLDELFEVLAEQWIYEHPGQNPGNRKCIELRTHVADPK